ncbi:MAG TPA: glycosyltransferase [Acetobacteraceae bacterium]
MREANSPHSYGAWITLWDDWRGVVQEQLLASAYRAKWPCLSAVVFHRKSDIAALAATVASLRQQCGFADLPVYTSDADAPAAAALSQASGEYVAVLQAGEVVPAHAFAVLADQAARHDLPDMLCADEDLLGGDGRRRTPFFKPEINHALALSGILTRGIWLVRRAALMQLTHGLPGWAEATRLDAYLRLYEQQTPPRTHRVPFVLTHRRCDTGVAPDAILVGIARQHLQRMGMAAELASPKLPLRWRLAVAPDRQPKVSLIVPSAAKSPHVTTCLRAVLQRTAYRRFDIVVVVSQDHPLEPVQQNILAPVLADPRARAVVLDVAEFNYSKANNFGASVSDSEILCLLNDDVEPIEPRWLEYMVGHLSDPHVGAVGAKLIYPDGRVQHGGVIIGLAGLCEHAFRNLRRDEPGYWGRAILEQEMSAVTGAALLVRRNAFEAVDGLDEGYAIAFNDVDFCLRMREKGWSIVFSAAAELRHHESVSLGYHFSGERAALEGVEVARMRQRWRSVCIADPFHNPNLLLTLGREWTIAFPPRVERPYGEILDELSPLYDTEPPVENHRRAILSDTTPRTRHQQPITLKTMTNGEAGEV